MTIATTDWIDTLREVGAALARARANEAEARAKARKLALEAINAGQSEHSVAKALGVDRMAVRRWQGKR